MFLDEGALGVLWERVVYLFEPDIIDYLYVYICIIKIRLD